MTKNYFIYIFTILLIGCSNRPDSFTPYLTKSKNFDFLVQKGKTHWEKRVEPNEAIQSNLFLSKAYDLDPNSFEVAVLYLSLIHI